MCAEVSERFRTDLAGDGGNGWEDLDTVRKREGVLTDLHDRVRDLDFPDRDARPGAWLTG